MVKVFVFCFFLFTLEMLTNAHTVHGKSTLKDFERFRKYGLFREHMEAMKALNAMKAKVILDEHIMKALETTKAKVINDQQVMKALNAMKTNAKVINQTYKLRSICYE